MTLGQCELSWIALLIGKGMLALLSVFFVFLQVTKFSDP
jgi:hypothetical protein